MEGLQSRGGQATGGVSAHGQVHVQNKLHLRVLGHVGIVDLQAAGPGVDLGGAAGIQLHLDIVAAGEDPVLG